MALILSVSVNIRGCVWMVLGGEYSGEIQGARMNDGAPSFRVEGEECRGLLSIWALHREMSY